MVIIKIIYLIGGICLILGGLIYLFFRHQRRLKARAFLMREAVRNGDYAFRLSNNGEPIPADVAREIFIPFFTTKSSGTGIGLSLSRQMLMMQNIELGLADTSISGYHVTFYLEKQKD